MRTPESNGLFEVNGAKSKKDNGFFCMQLASFLAEDNITEWDEYHEASVKAGAGECLYKEKCHIYQRTTIDDRQ